jgi:hypothetical protein
MPGMKRTMDEWKSGELRSGSKHGPVVKSQAQAVAIGLSEERKAGHKVKNKHEPTAPGHMGHMHDHHEEQGHKMHGPKGGTDGAGRKGHDMEIRGHTEHKEPTHPAGSHTMTGHIPESEGVAGHPGTHLDLKEDGHTVGRSFKQSDHEPAVLSHEPGQAGYPGQMAGMGNRPHGFGHSAPQRSGVLRNSGHPGAHRLGKR